MAVRFTAAAAVVSLSITDEGGTSSLVEPASSASSPSCSVAPELPSSPSLSESSSQLLLSSSVLATWSTLGARPWWPAAQHVFTLAQVPHRVMWCVSQHITFRPSAWWWWTRQHAAIVSA